MFCFCSVTSVYVRKHDYGKMTSMWDFVSGFVCVGGVCLCVCLSVCWHVCIRMFVESGCVLLWVCVYLCMCVCVSVCVCVLSLTLYVYACLWVCVCVCVCWIWLCLCVCVCVCTLALRLSVPAVLCCSIIHTIDTGHLMSHHKQTVYNTISDMIYNMMYVIEQTVISL